ncbi:uncharacterized protein LOC126784638 [Argentina anserina]|uniref:uncharacterized protein LOC126784638 n=1 Tax=Argentina anserina TaxID=57926 RepID=UPI0021763061|nr:uncharacterized protein LOC126784638 [Potentilla anserina]
MCFYQTMLMLEAIGAKSKFCVPDNFGRKSFSTSNSPMFMVSQTDEKALQSRGTGNRDPRLFQTEEMSDYFREEEEEEEEEDQKENMDISPLSLPRQQFDKLTIHSPPSSVQQRKRSKPRISRFSPTQFVKFHNLTLDSPNPEPRPPLEEASTYRFRTLKRKRHSGPSLNTKRELSGHPQRHGSCKRSRTNRSMSWHFGYPEESPVRNQVKEIPEILEADESPFFMKSMIRSNISVCFMLTLPKRFCSLHLPLYGTATITLEDKDGDEFETNFLADKRALSGGWKGFCQAKDLRLDDVLVFHLVSPLKFKVHKLRPEYDLSEEDVDAAFFLLKMSASGQILFEEKPPLTPPRDVFHGNIGEKTLIPDLNVQLVDDEESEDHRDKEFGSNSTGRWIKSGQKKLIFEDGRKC